MPIPKFIRKMHSVVKRSLLCSCVVVLLVVCLAYGVLGKHIPEESRNRGEQAWYEGKDLQLVHVVREEKKLKTRKSQDLFENFLNKTFLNAPSYSDMDIELQRIRTKMTRTRARLSSPTAGVI